MKTLSIGINGGATHTTARLIVAGNAFGDPAEAGPSNPRTIGVDRAALAIAGVFRAVQATMPPWGVLDIVAAGVAGTGVPSRHEALKGAVEAIIEREIHLCTDAEAALWAAAPEGPALILIAGTGSIAWGRTADGRLERAGGLGADGGDPGSATRIGNDAREAALREHISPELAGMLQKRDRQVPAATLAVEIDRLAESGDPTAQTILRSAAEALALMARDAWVKLGRPDEIPFALTGGVLTHSTLVRRFLGVALEDCGVRLRPYVLETPPEVGAVAHAAAMRAR